MKCLILCAGRGSRINEGFADYVPKPLRLYLGRPILQHKIRQLNRASLSVSIYDRVTEYGIIIDPDFEELYKETLGNNSMYTFIPGNQNGTADNVYLSRDFIGSDKKFLVTSGDVIIGEGSLTKIMSSSPVLFGVYKVNDASEGIDIIVNEAMELIRADGQPAKGPGLFDAGIYVLDQPIFSVIPTTKIDPSRNEIKLIDSIVGLTNMGKSVKVSMIEDFYRHFTYKRDLDS